MVQPNSLNVEVFANSQSLVHCASDFDLQTAVDCKILAHLVYQFIEIFVHRHCTGHYPISGGSGIEILLRICCLIGYYHNTAFILGVKKPHSGELIDWAGWIDRLSRVIGLIHSSDLKCCFISSKSWSRIGASGVDLSARKAITAI